MGPLADLARRLEADGWTVRKLRARKFGGPTAEALLKGEPVRWASLVKAAELVGCQVALVERGGKAVSRRS